MSKYNNLLQEVIGEAAQLNIPVSSNINSNITINTRAKGRFGQCKKRNGKYTIEISQHLTQAKQEHIKETLVHEILHTCPNCMNHGKQWKYYAMRMNMKYGYEISRTNSCENLGITSPKIESANYAIVCNNCGKTTYRQRESKVIKNPEKFRCKCGGKLEVYKTY